jgi:hypothetical protein
MESSSRSLLPSWACTAFAALTAFFSGWLGLHLGETFAYAIAARTDRDFAELKGMLIWCIILGAVVCAFAGVWLVLWLTRSRTWAQRSAFIALSVVTLGAAVIIFSTYLAQKFRHP